MCNGQKVKPLHIIIPETSTYVEIMMDKLNVIEDHDLLKKYDIIWDKVRTYKYLKKEFDSDFIYHQNFLKTKRKSYGDEGTDFYDKEILKIDSNHTCLAVISLDSDLKKNENYYPQLFLKECKYIEKKVIRHINDNLSDLSSDGDSDEE